ncbi:MAG: hypothetical protein ACO1N5_17535 [Noviherbaspirillum sp.]
MAEYVLDKPGRPSSASSNDTDKTHGDRWSPGFVISGAPRTVLLTPAALLSALFQTLSRLTIMRLHLQQVLSREEAPRVRGQEQRILPFDMAPRYLMALRGTPGEKDEAVIGLASACRNLLRMRGDV